MTELEKDYRFRPPSHACLTSLIDKTRFQQLAEKHGFPVPRSYSDSGISGPEPSGEN